jgi:hypothetical protein
MLRERERARRRHPRRGASSSPAFVVYYGALLFGAAYFMARYLSPLSIGCALGDDGGSVRAARARWRERRPVWRRALAGDRGGRAAGDVLGQRTRRI